MIIYPVVVCPRCGFPQTVSVKEFGVPLVMTCDDQEQAGCGSYFAVEVRLSPEITVYKLDRVQER